MAFSVVLKTVCATGTVPDLLQPAIVVVIEVEKIAAGVGHPANAGGQAPAAGRHDDTVAFIKNLLKG